MPQMVVSVDELDLVCRALEREPDAQELLARLRAELAHERARDPRAEAEELRRHWGIRDVESPDR